MFSLVIGLWLYLDFEFLKYEGKVVGELGLEIIKRRLG